MENSKDYKVKNTPINMAHNKVRSAYILQLDFNKCYEEYKQLGGKRDLETLIRTKPIYQNSRKGKK